MTPERLGKYEIRGTLGQGAMGLVYDGWDPLIMRRVAIKTVALAQGDDADAAEGVERFRREAQAAGRLQHPNIVSVFDFGETETLAYIVMEFMDGGTLKDLLDRDRKLVPAQACDMMCQVLSALAYSHARGVVHRDVKPANIMLDQHGAVKLGDFGIARLESSSMTLVGDVLGTPAYMAPEQFLGETADARADIFAAGATLFHLLTGTRPYEGSRTTVRQKVLTATQAPSASERAAEVPNALDAVLQRAMARQAADRFQTAADFANAVRGGLVARFDSAPVDDDSTVFVRGADANATQAMANRVVPVVPVEAAKPTARRGAPVGLLAGAAVLLAAGGGAAWYFTQSKPAAPVPAPAVVTPKPVPQAPLPAPAPSTPLPAPVAPATPRPSPAEAARAAGVAATVVNCALVRVQPTETGLSVGGIAGAGDPLNSLHDVVSKAAQGLDTEWAVATFQGPYCAPLAGIRAAWSAGALELGLQNQDREGLAAPGTVLTDGQLMKPVIRGLDFPAWVRVDDFDASGMVTHMYPQVASNGIAADPEKLLHVGKALVLGRAPHTQFGVGAPYGTDLIVAIASSEKILPGNRPNVEKASAYLAALQAAIDAAATHGDRLAAGAIAVTTSKK
jgi:serine/threonine-protein kinase